MCARDRSSEEHPNAGPAVERSRQLARAAAEVAEQLASIEREVNATHERIAATHPTDPRFGAIAEHARTSAERAAEFAAAQRRVAAAEDPAHARKMLRSYHAPEPQREEPADDGPPR